VFITNVVKCRPPGNRDPEPSEIAACAPYLKRQLEVLDPAVVVTLGRHSLQTYMPGARISAAHGTARQTDPETGARHATTYAMYHPAAALRQHSLKETMLTDMCGLPEVLIASRKARAEAGAIQPATTSDAALPAPDESALATTPEEAPALSTAPAEASADVTEIDDAVTVAVGSQVGPSEPQMELFG
jgi:hypothetical protein